jgi:hypothetical protein
MPESEPSRSVFDERDVLIKHAFLEFLFDKLVDMRPIFENDFDSMLVYTAISRFYLKDERVGVRGKHPGVRLRHDGVPDCRMDKNSARNRAPEIAAARGQGAARKRAARRVAGGAERWPACHQNRLYGGVAPGTESDRALREIVAGSRLAGVVTNFPRKHGRPPHGPSAAPTCAAVFLSSSARHFSADSRPRSPGLLR